MKNWMKNIICSREWTGIASGMDRVWSRIHSFFHSLTPDPILSRICVVSLILMIVDTVNVWGETVTIDSYYDFTDKTNESDFWGTGAAGPFAKTTADGATFTLSGGDIRKWCDSNESNCHFYLSDGNAATLSWTQPTGYTIAVDSISINAFMKESKGKLYIWSNDNNIDHEFYVIAAKESNNTNSAGLTKNYVYHSQSNDKNGVSAYLFPGGNKMGVNDNFKIKPTSTQGRINWIKLRYELTPISYTVTLDNESPTTEGSTSVSLTYDSNTHASITNPTMEDYTFGGWWTGDNGTGDMVIAADGTMQANVTGYTGADGVWKMAGTTTLYAKWISNAKTITLDNQSATTAGSTSISVLYGKSDNLTGTPAITVPARTGYTFEGYYTATSGGGVQIIAANGNVNESVTGYTDSDKKWIYDGDVTLYAYWKQNQSITWSQTISNSVRSTVIELSASASSELTVSYTATSNEGTVSIDGSTLTCLTAGSVTVTAHQTGNSSWEPAADVSKTFTILEHSITTNPSASGITYEQTLASSTLSGGVATVGGTWAWDDSSIEPNAGTTSYIAVFTPDNTSGAFTTSDTLHCNVSVTTAKATPDISCDIDDEYEIGHSNLDLQTLWTREGDGTITYSKVSFVASGENNDGATEPAIKADGYTLTLGQAGALTIQMAIAAGTNYNARTVTKEITIYKKANAVFAEGVADYSSEMYMNSTHADIELIATNTNYSGEYGSAIGVRQLNMKNDSVTYTYNASTRKLSVSSSYYIGTVYFEISQPDNYLYAEAKDTISILVKLQAEATDCYVLDTITTDEKGKGAWELYTVADGPALKLHAPGKEMTFYGSKSILTAGGEVSLQYATDGTGSSFKDIPGITMPVMTDTWSKYGPYPIPEGTTHIRFITTFGATNWKYYGNVKVTRKTWVKADTLRIDKTAGDNPIYPSDGVGVGTLVVDYALASGGNLHIENDNPKFSLSRSTITGVDCKTDTAHIVVSYSSTVAGRDTAHIVIYNDTKRTSTIITGTTIKHDQDGSWKANLGLLQVGAEVSGLYTTNLEDDPTKVEYTILSGSDYVSISEGTLTAVAAGVARIQAYVEGDADYYDKYDTIDITVTDKDIQYIVWGEGMESTLRNLVTGESTVTIEASAQSDIDGCTTNGTRTVTFTSRNSSVVSVDGTTLTIVGKGKTWLVASQAGGKDEDDHDYYPVTDSLRVVVRAPGDMCEEDRVFEQAGETKLSHKDGDRYSSEFSFGGNEPGVYSVVYKGEKGNNNEPTGTVYVEQYVSGAWVGLGEGAIEEKSRYDTIRGQFNRTATKMRIRTNGKGHHYFKEIAVLRAEYTDMVESEVVKETLVFSSYIGTPQKKAVKVRWYSRKDLEMVLSEGAPFTITGELDRECRVETTDLTITYTPTVAESHGTYSLLFTDGIEDGFRHTVTLDATATAQEVTLSADADWAEGSWSPSSPNANKTAKIAANVTISTQVSVYGLTIEDGATVTITPTGGLTVGVGGISGASATSLILETDDDTETPSSTLGQTGYLRISPDYVGDMPSATVKLFSKAYSNDEVYNWQYVGIPLGDDNVYGWDICTYGQQYIYGWNEEAGDWFDAFEERVYPFQGYCLTQENNSKGRTFTFAGTLAAPSSTLEPISLSYTSAMADGVKGYHVLANSFAAPIDISRFEVEDFFNATATIYLFNTGYYEKGGNDGIVDVDKWEEANAGQYIAIPVETANTVREVEASFPVLIPAMQGFCVKANSTGASLKLDYNELVWKADYSKHPNKPMRVAAQKTEEQEETNESDLTDFIKVTLSDGEAADNLYLLASASYDKSYENGYDAPKMMSDDPALPNIFAVEDDGQFAIDATSDIEDTFIGVRTGAASNYTIYFSHVNAETEWMLLDIQENKKTRIANEASYSFSAKANSLLTNRFVIVEWDGNAGTATGTEETTIQNKIQKFIYNDQLFILKDGVLYDARGMVVRR